MTADLSEVETGFTWPEDIYTTEGYEQHQAEVMEWLQLVSREKLGSQIRSSIDTLDSFAERYGYQEMDGRDALVRQASEDRPNFRLALQRQHLGMVAGSPTLRLYQKGDLLALSAQALYDGKLPVNGGLMVQMAVQGARRRNMQAARAMTEADQRIAAVKLYFDSLYQVVVDGVPTMTTRAYFLHLASRVTGEEVTSPLKAMGVAMTVANQPSPKAVRKTEARKTTRSEKRLKRLESRRDRNMQRFARSGEAVIEAKQAELLRDIPDEG